MRLFAEFFFCNFFGKNDKIWKMAFCTFLAIGEKRKLRHQIPPRYILGHHRQWKFLKKTKFFGQVFSGQPLTSGTPLKQNHNTFFEWGNCYLHHWELPSRGSQIPKMSLHGLKVCLWQPKMWKMWKKSIFQNFSFFKARLAFHHVGWPNIDVLRGF